MFSWLKSILFKQTADNSFISAMEIDYYGVLGVQRKCNDYEIKQAFRRLVIQYNPERQKDESLMAMYALTAEAYDVLSDPLRRAVYDQYGEKGLKKGVPGPEDYIQPYVYHGDPLRTYREFFGTESPYADLLDVLIKPLPLYDLPEGKGVKRKEPPLVKPLLLTLNEVFQGGVKKLKIQHLVLMGDDYATTELQEKILTIPIKPGILQGEEFRFVEEGDQGPTIIAADVVFVIEDRPHERFFREGINLVTILKVSLLEALVGTTVVVDTLDGRTLRIPITEIIHVDYEKVVEGEGMPTMEDPRVRGDLIIKFKIEFPDYLPKKSKDLVKKAFKVASQAGGTGSPEWINQMILADKMARIAVAERMPQ